MFLSSTPRDAPTTCSPSSSSIRGPPQRLHGLSAAGRMLSPTEAIHEGRRAMAPPNVTVVQGPGPFGSHPPPTSSMLSYLYQSGLYSAAAAAAAAQQQQQLPRPFASSGPQRPHHPLDPASFLHGPPPVSTPSLSADATGFPFPAPAELTSAGLVAAAAAAAGLHLNPAALMLSAAGQLAAHPWLYPGYLAAAAALGQSAAVALHPGTEPSVSVDSPPSPSARRRHHIVSSSSRFAPYSTSDRRRSTPTERSLTTSTAVPRAATPPPAPDTTDSPPAEVVSPSPPSASPRPASPTGNCDDQEPDRGQLKNMEQMVNGLDHLMKARIVTSSSAITDASSNDVDVVNVDSSEI